MKIGILGAGTFGTALGRMLANDNYDVTIYTSTGRNFEMLNNDRIHPNLKDVKIPESIKFTKDIKECCDKAKMIIFAVPSIYIRQTARKAKDYIKDDIGDLIVTATSKHSRNNRCGFLIGQGLEVEEAIKEVGMAVEGINALPAAIKLMKKYDVEMPIIMAVNAVINKTIDPKTAVATLMSRDKKNENNYM